ncbi:hypothetical protein BJL95_11485 [Methylomonas sp. LWB]|uniref:PepSY-associated TM helix domain-containing protein n=1 Tax=Methylomonas sp. LWB TaxID=1905845 RepID=UPI0008DAFBB0|nr:PepSY-associated TM helix domain-containing protein [Methylomonas sp. LWB]OHX36378.1 hypothetical protein BJL95_11485 [Methylomonas sp. LWB]
MSTIEPVTQTIKLPVAVAQPLSLRLFKQLSLRKILLKLHLYISLWFGAMLSLAGLTGSLLVYENGLDKWLNSELMTVAPGDSRLPYSALLAAANTATPIKVPAAYMLLPEEPDDVLIVRYAVPMSEAEHAEHAKKGGMMHRHHFHEVMVNPYTGQVIGDRDKHDSLMSIILRLHFKLLVDDTGKLIMGITALLALVLTITGIYLWWPKLGKIKQAFLIKPNASFTRFNFDLHKTVGIYTALVMLSVCLSGVYFNLPEIFKPAVNWFSPIDEAPMRIMSLPTGDQPISPDQAIARALATFPDLRPQRVNLPEDPYGSYSVSGRQPGELRHKGATRIWLDQYSGAVIQRRDPERFNPGTAFINLQLPLHNGEILGEIGRVLVLIAGLAPLILTVTGTIHWLKKRRSKRLHRQRELRAG